MQKEIHEQPRAIADTIEAVIDAGGFSAELFGKDAADVLADVEGVQILACGTRFYSGSVARYWIEAITGLPCNVEIASESSEEHRSELQSLMRRSYAVFCLNKTTRHYD